MLGHASTMTPFPGPHSRGGEPGDVQTHENFGSFSKPLADAKKCLIFMVLMPNSGFQSLCVKLLGI